MKQNNAKSAIKTTIAASLACLSPQLSTAHGEDGAHKTEDLGTTTVVARRALQDIGATTSELHTLSAESLRERGIYGVSDALATLPGVDVSSFSQPGNGQGVRIRGLRPQDTQFRIDGVRFTRRLGNFDSFIGQSFTTGLSRVELLKGSQAALYGSTANGGVVNLITQRGSQDRLSSISVEAGSFNSLSVTDVNSGSKGKLSYYLSSRFSTTDNDTYGDNSEAGGYDSDYVNLTTAFRLGYALSDDLELGITYRQMEGTVEGPQFGGSRSENDFSLGTIYADYRINDAWKTKLTLSYLMENSVFSDPFSKSHTDYDQFGIAWENAYQYSGAGSLSFGAEYENQDYRGFGATTGVKDHYFAVYLNHSYDFKNLTIDAGIRYEDYQSFGSHTSWKAGARYNLDKTNTVFTANVATGFNTPSLIQLYSPLDFGIAGNPNLDPETTFGWDIGVEQKLNENHSASIAFFETDIEDAIQRDFGAGLFANSSGKTKASGIEAAFIGDITPNVAYELSYTWLDRSLNDQPQQTAKANITYKPNSKTVLGLGAQYLDERSYGGNTLEDAFIVRAYGSYQLTDNVKFNARIENLTDTEYSHVDFTSSFGPGDSPARRLGVFGGVTINW